MTEYRGTWDETEVTTFLQEAKIPIRLAVRKGDESLWVVTLWFQPRDGDLFCATEADSHVIRFLRANPAVAFDISTNDVPYRGIRGNGTVSISADEDKVVLKRLIDRYLGDTDTSLARWLLSDDRDECAIRIHPEQVFSWDYSQRMS